MEGMNRERREIETEQEVCSEVKETNVVREIEEYCEEERDKGCSEGERKGCN